MILSAFRRRHQDDVIRTLYGAIVAQARSAAFYAHYGVADSIEGRFELLVLHLVLVLRRLDGGVKSDPHGGLKPDPRPASSIAAVGQQLFDLFCRDLDDNLREMGVGDLAVPRRMRQFGEAFYGRQAAYRAALEAANPQELEKALARNILGQTETNENAARLARYTRSAVARLAAAADDALLAGKVEFPNPETLQNG
jgi:cytochrome b pre-mRNA-processing protein 3